VRLFLDTRGSRKPTITLYLAIRNLKSLVYTGGGSYDALASLLALADLYRPRNCYLPYAEI
jgi:hypothetical protein